MRLVKKPKGFSSCIRGPFNVFSLVIPVWVGFIVWAAIERRNNTYDECHQLAVCDSLMRQAVWDALEVGAYGFVVLALLWVMREVRLIRREAAVRGQR